MDYIDLLNLKKEPFSISPDPNFFYHSRDYEECLQKLELSIRLRRGLNIVIGDVGTGKTTLSRALIQLFQGFEDFRFHLILDPSFNSEQEFLLSLIKIFNIPTPEEGTSLAFKEAIRTYLLKEGLEKKRIIVLIIDETQKMDYPFMELLRDFLNFETNEHKLLQLVLLGQTELLEKIKEKKNFIDRVNLIYFLKPLSLQDTREMIEFRLRKAGFFSQHPLFTMDAFRKIHYYTQGYPRKIVNLCHHSLLLMLIKRKAVTDGDIIESVAKSIFPGHLFQESAKSGFSLLNGRKMAMAVEGSVVVGILVLLLIIAWPRWSLYFKGFNNKPISSQPIESILPGQQPGIMLPEQQPGIKSVSENRGMDKSDKKNKFENDDNYPSFPIREVDIPYPDVNRHLTSENLLVSEKIKTYRLMVVSKGDNISGLASRLYGLEVTDEILLLIKKANPKISDVDLIEPGQYLYFPVIDHKGTGEKDFSLYGVQMGYFSTLAKAQDCLNSLKGLSSVDIGNRIYIEKEDFPGQGEKYLTIIGPFAEITKAWGLLEKLDKKKFENPRVVIIK